MDQFLKKLHLPTGSPSDIDMIRSKLMFNIDTILDDIQVGRVIEQISIYDYEFHDVFVNLMEMDQKEYIKVLIEINSQKHLSKCQKKLFSLVKVKTVSYTHLTLPTKRIV